MHGKSKQEAYREAERIVRDQAKATRADKNLNPQQKDGRILGKAAALDAIRNNLKIKE